MIFDYSTFKPFKMRVLWERGQVGELPESYLQLLDLAEDSHYWVCILDSVYVRSIPKDKNEVLGGIDHEHRDIRTDTEVPG